MEVKHLKIFLLLMATAILNSCSMLLPDRSFIEQMEREDESFYRPGKDFPVVSGDTGEMSRSHEEIQKRTPQNERRKHLKAEGVSLMEELQVKEEGMEGDELQKYTHDKQFLQTDSDKLYYISLSTHERISYIEAKKQDLKEELDQKHSLVKRHSIHSSELFIGMDKSAVVEAWGKPAKIEIAGNPNYQNERWSFVEDGSVKQVYFEAGRLQGWALDL